VSTAWFVEGADAKRVLSGRPEADPIGAWQVATDILGRTDVEDLGSVSIWDAAAVPNDGVLYIGVYPGVTVVCTPELDSVDLADIPPKWWRHSGTSYFACSRPEDAYGGFSQWEGRRLVRAFAATPTRIWTDEGLPQRWETPYWAGQFPLQYPVGMSPELDSLPFHPQQFAEAANLAWLGFRYTRPEKLDAADPMQLKVNAFRITPTRRELPDGDPAFMYPAGYASEPEREPASVGAAPSFAPGRPAFARPSTTPAPLVKLRNYFGF
jgi:hypothetical protein